MKLTDVQVDDGLPKGRAGWSFLYRSEPLAEAAKKQAKWHREREAFYAHEATVSEADLRESAVELREQQVTGGPRFQAVLDQEKGERLADQRQRRDRHAASAKTFEAYAAAFGALSQVSFHLTIGDVDYFALHREPGE